ncbi:HAD family hydrolase [Candidatus Thorarchaeota archaeon]|nr:MAG: HAD family hydrolase [Candidatus Thorarchaeota archaeon]
MKADAILFDLHHTLTGTRISPFQLLREIGQELDVYLEGYSDEELENAFNRSDGWLTSYLVSNNVDIHWGDNPADWLVADRIMFETLGVSDLTDDVIMEFETRWRQAIRGPEYEYFTQSALKTVSELSERGYTLGICTRRFHDPSYLIQSSGVEDLFSVVTWSGVPGYAKPNPYTLLEAAERIGMNPKLCAYIGNLVDADVEAARRAEMIPILTTWADAAEADKAPQDTVIVESLLDLLELFE